MASTLHNHFMGSDPSKLAVLIDGDNAYLEYIERVMAYASRHGPVAARRIYGAHDKLDSHLECIKRHGFKPTYAEGQNAADTALIIDAMEMFRSKVAEGYCIVTSDNDFAELARRLRKEGAFVAGIGGPGQGNIAVQGRMRRLYVFRGSAPAGRPGSGHPGIRACLGGGSQGSHPRVREGGRLGLSLGCREQVEGRWIRP